jgi:cyclic pyranopterin phosphate synthase
MAVQDPLSDRPPRRRLPLLEARHEPRPAALDRPAPSAEAVGAAPSDGPRAQIASPRSVRISVTDRCDYACTYCRPSRSEGYAERRLSLDEWRTMLDGLIAAGVERFRFTGGEPLLVPHLVDLVRHLSDRGVRDLALTTNASRLASSAKPLRDAGLMRINVSIDSLDPEKFSRMTRGGRLSDVLEGIDAAVAAGLEPIKLNAVVLRGVNDDELEGLTRFAWERRLVPRFLEVMPIAEGAKLVGEHLVTAAEMRARLAHLCADDPAVPEPDRGPARYLRARHDPTLRVGFISGTSDTYCGTCDRLRVSSTGTLRPCLATDLGVEAADVARGGDPAALRERLDEAWRQKPDGRTWKGCTEETAKSLSMRAIGG